MILNTKTTKILYKGLILIGVLALLTSCSRKKNKWVNRNFHAMTTYYNILYHGNIALEEGKTEVKETYQDDYWEILPIERLTNTDDAIVYGQMVEVPPSVMPRRPKPETEEGRDGKKAENKSQERTLEDAFKDFGNTGQFGNDPYNQNNQYGNDPMGGRNQGNQYGNQPMGGRNQGNQYGNQPMGGRNQGNQYGNQPMGGRNQGNQYGNQPMGGRNQGNQYGNQGNQYGNQPMGGRNQGNQYGNQPMGGRNQGNQYGNQPMGGRNQGGQFGQNPQMGNRNQGGVGRQAPNANAPGSSQRGNAGRMDPQNPRDSRSASFDEEVESAVSGAFALAEEKASKGIQKHNMLIKGEEYNPQMKDAFLLLGKSRYYQKRYFPALEAFNYILSKYDDEKVMASAEIWREKTYMRLENYERVIRNLSPIVHEPSEELSIEDIIDAATALAQAYFETDQKEEALKILDIAINTTKDKEQKGRFHYIKGQIFQSLGQIDSSNTSFNRVIKLKRNSPRIYMINAYMEKAKNFDYNTGDKEALLDTLNRLLIDRENRPYKDIINYRIAEYYKDLDDMPSAIVAYNRSLRTGTTNHGLKKRIYQILGNYNFDKARYKEAGAYYDSTMVNMPEISLEYRRMKRKRLSLNDVIMYEEVAKINDSILALVNMSETQRIEYFQKHVDTLKEQAIANAEKAIEQSKKAKRPTNMFATQNSQAGRPGRGFYFYDEAQVRRGMMAFKQVWGERALQDNWRFERGRAETERAERREEKSDPKAEYLAMIEADPLYQVDTYIGQIPTDPEFIEELEDDRNFSYYQLGVIYHEKFSEYELAAGRLESLLEKKPEERLVLPAKYNLYKIYMQLDKKTEADKWKTDIIKNYPDSRYAKILLNPESLKEDASNPIQIYNALYKDYKDDKLTKVIREATEYADIFLGHAMVPKFELLKATAIGRLYGFEAYEQALDYVALAYPQSEEGKQAEKVLQEVLPNISNRDFDDEFVEEMKFNLVYPFNVNQRSEAENLVSKLNEAIEEFEEKSLSTTIDVYSEDMIFVVVKGLKSKIGAEGFGAKLRRDKNYNLDFDNFGVSTKNYEVILIHKRLEDYRQRFN